MAQKNDGEGQGITKQTAAVDSGEREPVLVDKKRSRPVRFGREHASIPLSVGVMRAGNNGQRRVTWISKWLPSETSVECARWTAEEFLQTVTFA
jgi:hypothetical protein